MGQNGLQYLSNNIKWKNIVKIKSCKVLAHRMDHSKTKWYFLCNRQLRTPRDDCAVRVQRFSSVIIAVGRVFTVYFCHAREPLYSNSAVIAWCSQSSGAQKIPFWFTVIHSMSQYFTAFNFHDIFFIWNYCLGIVVHSGPIRAFKF